MMTKPKYSHKSAVLLAVVMSIFGIIAWFIWSNDKPTTSDEKKLRLSGEVVAVSRVKELVPTSTFKKDDSAAPESKVVIGNSVVDQYIALEESGDTSSKVQLKKYRLLDFCSKARMTPDLINRSQLNLEQREEMLFFWNKCKGIYDHLNLSPLEMGDLAETWLESAADEGNPVAKLESISNYPIPPTYEEALELIYPALEYSHKEPEFRESTYFNVLGFYVENHLSSSETGHTRTEDHYSWEYLACKYSEFCRLQEHLEGFSRELPPHQVEQVIVRADAIEEAVENSDWPLLNLELTSDDLGNPL